MKLKILHLTQFLGVGGLEKVLFLLINEQLKAGHEVELVVYDYEQSWVDHFRRMGINVDTSFKKLQGYDIKLLKYLSKKTKGFDIVHTHDLNPLMYAAPVKFLHRLAGKRFPKLIHTAHGMDHLHKRPITKLYEKTCSILTNYTIGVSTAVCEYYYKLGVSKKKVLNINNGTLISNPDNQDIMNARKKIRAEFCLPEENIIWVSVARIVPLKDQLLICDLAEQFKDMTFLLVGPSGDDEYWQTLSNKKKSNVIMTGPRADITNILMAADFFISASRHEGIPVSVLEAGAVGIPCLLSDIPGHRVIQDGKKNPVAIFFQTGNIEDLKDKVEEIKQNRSLTQPIATALKEHVRDHFSSETMYKRYLEAYIGTKCSES